MIINSDNFIHIRGFNTKQEERYLAIRKTLNMYRWKRLASPFTKLLKHDIRRDFMQMHINALNSTDLLLFKGFFERFCSPDCYVHFKNVRYDHPYHMDQVNIESFGLDRALQLYGLLPIKYPDLIFHFDDVQIIRELSSSESRIVAKINGRGTDPLAEYPSLRELFSSLKVHNSNILTSNISSSVTSTDNFPYKNYFPNNIINVNDNTPLDAFYQYMSRAGGITFDGSLTLHINENNKIYAIVFC